MQDDTISLILTELRDLREDLGQFTRAAEGRLAALELGMYDLRGNGQPGRVSKLESQVHGLDKWRYKTIGYASGVAACVSVLGRGLEMVFKR